MRAVPAAAAVVWLNLYLIRQAFFIEYSGFGNAMHGFWMTLAAVPFWDWLRPTWWSLWDAGMPLEYTYTPLLPWTMRALALGTGIPLAQAWHVCVAAIYVGGPVTLWWACWKWSDSWPYSLAAALIYSLSSPVEWVAPDAGFAWRHIGDARRMHLAFAWDDAPHLLALALFPLAVLAWHRYLDRASGGRFAQAVLTTAATVLANAFGAALLALAALCLLAVRGRATLGLAPVALTAYLLISPWLPPSLIAVIRRNSDTYALGAWTTESWIALGITLAFWVPLAWLLRRFVRDGFLSFWILLAVLFACVTVLHHYQGWHFLPQPGRYKLETELALIVALVFGARRLFRELPASVPLVLAAAMIPLGVEQVISHRRYSKALLRDVPASSMVEHRLAQQLDRFALGPRLFAPGSVAPWFNHWSQRAQLAGGSFPTAMNGKQQEAVNALYGRIDPPHEILWLKAFGVGSILMTNQEFWRPYANVKSLEGKLPVLWHEGDSRLYQVPLRHRSLAHVIPPGAAGDLSRYVAALEDPSLPAASFEWKDRSRAVVSAAVGPEQAVSVQINHHHGWRARRGQKDIAVQRDGLGLILLEPDCNGDCRIDLEFTGGWEAALTRFASLAALVSLLAPCRRR